VLSAYGWVSNAIRTIRRQSVSARSRAWPLDSMACSPECKHCALGSRHPLSNTGSELAAGCSPCRTSTRSPELRRPGGSVPWRRVCISVRAQPCRGEQRRRSPASPPLELDDWRYP